MKTTAATFAAIGGLLSLAAIGMNSPVLAAEKGAAMEKCYGVAKAGKNDCAGPAHACAGQSKMDNGATEFITVPKGTCERLAGGSLTAK